MREKGWSSTTPARGAWSSEVLVNRAADPPTFVTIALLVAAIALVASYVPARRARRIDPAQTLRAD